MKDKSNIVSTGKEDMPTNRIKLRKQRHKNTYGEKNYRASSSFRFKLLFNVVLATFTQFSLLIFDSLILFPCFAR